MIENKFSKFEKGKSYSILTDPARGDSVHDISKDVDRSATLSSEGESISRHFNDLDRSSSSIPERRQSFRELLSRYREGEYFFHILSEFLVCDFLILALLSNVCLSALSFQQFDLRFPNHFDDNVDPNRLILIPMTK